MKNAGQRETQSTLPRTWTLTEAALELRVSYWWLSRLFRSGKLPEPQRLAQTRILTEADLARVRELIASRPKHRKARN